MRKGIFILLFSILLFSCKKDLEIIYFEINPENAELALNEELYIKASVSFCGEDSVKMVWESNNPQIATVDDFGYVKAIGIGDAIISVHCGDMCKNCNISVRNDTVK